MDAEGLIDGLVELDAEALGELLGLVLAEGLIDALALADGDRDGLWLTLEDGLWEGETDTEGLTDADGDTEGDTLEEPGGGGFISYAPADPFPRFVRYVPSRSNCVTARLDRTMFSAVAEPPK